MSIIKGDGRVWAMNSGYGQVGFANTEGLTVSAATTAPAAGLTFHCMELTGKKGFYIYSTANVINYTFWGSFDEDQTESGLATIIAAPSTAAQKLVSIKTGQLSANSGAEGETTQPFAWIICAVDDNDSTDATANIYIAGN